MKISSLFFLLAVFYNCYVMSMEERSQELWHQCPDTIIMHIVALLKPCDKQSFCLINKKCYALAGKENIKDLLHWPCILNKNQHVDFMVFCAKNDDKEKMFLAIKNASLCKRKNAVSIISYFIHDRSSNIDKVLSLYIDNPCDEYLKQLWPIIKFVYGSDKASIKYKNKYLPKNLREKLSPLQAAVYCNDISVARLFLSQGKQGIINLMIANYMPSNTLLHIAVSKCYVAMVRLLCKDYRFNINAQSFSGRTPLHIAVILSNTRDYNDKLKIIQILLQAGANPNIQTRKSRLTVLMSAISASLNKNIIEFLLQQGVLVNMQNRDGETAAMIAVNNDYYDALQLLLKYNADINIKNNNGKSLLHIAVEKGNIKILNLLHRYGVDFNMKDSDGNSPLMILVYKNNHSFDLIKKNYNVFSSFGFLFNTFEMVKLLLDRGADPNIIGYNQDTPLMCAVRNGNIAMIELLLSHGADPNIKNLDGDDAWSMAHNDEIIKMLKINKKKLEKLNRPEHCIIS